MKANYENKDNEMQKIKQNVNKLLEGQNILWQGALYMSASHTANLSQKISEQKNGVVLFFQPYSTNTNSPQSFGFYTKFIPKKVIEMFGNGYGYCFNIPDNSTGIIAGKYLYLYDNKIVGNDQNVGTSIMFGTTINNKNAVLTAVIGV